MKQNIKFALFGLGIVLCLCACKKDYTAVESPSFEVAVDSTTYSVGKPIIFHFSGTADVITFFSGAPGSEYKFKDRTTVEGTPQMQFTSYRQFGATAATPDTTLKLMISNNFRNVFDVENLKAATWTDISDRAQFSTGTDNTPSGVINLADFNKKDSPVYVAFKYHDFKSAVSQRTWTIKNILVQNKLADSTLATVATSASISWGALDVLNNAKVWSFSSTQIQMAGGAIGTDDNEDWIISQPLFFNRTARAVGVSIRNNPTAVLTDYTFAGYSSPGTYTVSFEAINASKWDNKQVVKEITITVR
ncbi:DUF5017 domain-containing protein [Flavisolibacter ginsenosidimutans]|uniref:DUF5017 domain-containing protein n=1 Tax=Flavisolibacter ginsenosidimutans TaxID=661481 RepID=A0A5B8UD76_9BACT|nr:DUF5017 domain-containing protein [Flavisolibacter ginsenosidimutans]QEC54372.1 DUF5017 domain-containing protein [Flavisolibacter ginsenosidimutans]